MKIRYLILFFLLLTPGLTEAATVKTVNGKLYRDVYFKEVTEKGLVFRYKRGTLTFKPEELAPIYRKIYATQIEKYTAIAGNDTGTVQQKINTEINKLQKRPPAERLLPLASMRQFYTRGKYKNTKISWVQWTREVHFSFRAFEIKAVKMDIIEALLLIEQLKEAYQQYGMLTTELKKLHTKLAQSAIKQYAVHVEKLKDLNLEQKLKQAEKLYTAYKNLPVDKNELTKIIRDCKIEKGINMCKDTRSHAAAISILNKIIAENPDHPRLQEMKQIKARQEYLLQAKEDFEFLFFACRETENTPPRLIRIMKKAITAYADTPYIAYAQKKWNEIEADKERKRAEKREREERERKERARKARMEREAMERYYKKMERENKYRMEREKREREGGSRPCSYCHGAGTWYDLATHREKICSSCRGSGRLNY
ncbi:MAG: hypothetical protein IKB16_08005 [Lentisphaeria bacterium]|nr:hypothetical protein [Lentisphaeria bacterium]